MNIYYQPTIEEFYVGFEYEFFHPDSKWINCKVGEPDDWDLMDINDDLESDKIRVKHLDREDIESLGWHKEEENENAVKYHSGSHGLMKRVCEEEYIIIRYLCYGHEQMFKGIIKNKSELKQYMNLFNVQPYLADLY